jgi:hypothetical protein
MTIRYATLASPALHTAYDEAHAGGGQNPLGQLRWMLWRRRHNVHLIRSVRREAPSPSS